MGEFILSEESEDSDSSDSSSYRGKVGRSTQERKMTNKLIENSRLPEWNGDPKTWPEFAVNFPISLQKLETMAGLTLNVDWGYVSGVLTKAPWTK